MVRIEAGGGGFQVPESFNHQTCSYEQDHRERYFDYYKSTLKPGPPGAAP